MNYPENYQSVQDAWSIYERSFPASERRILAAYEVICRNEETFFARTEYREGKAAALLWGWETPEFTYLEHFAVLSEMRNAGFGGALLETFIKEHPNIILEVEPPDTALRQRRIRFYERHGLILNDFEYINPGYRVEPTPYPLRLMSTQPCTREECESFVEFIFRKPLFYKM